MTAAGRLNVVLVILFCGALGFWWWGLNDYRDTAASVAALKIQMAKMENHVKETERVLAAVESLKDTIRDARSESNAALEDSRCYIGVERIDRLERLLQEDLYRRGGNNSAGGTAHGLSGAGGRESGAAASQRE